MIVVSLAVSVSQLASLSTTQNLIIEADPSYKALPLKWRTPLVKSFKYYDCHFITFICFADEHSFGIVIILF